MPPNAQVLARLLVKAVGDDDKQVSAAAAVALEETASADRNVAAEVLKCCVSEVDGWRTNASAENATAQLPPEELEARKKDEAGAVARLRLCAAVCRAARRVLEAKSASAVASAAFACLAPFKGGTPAEIYEAAASAVAAAARVDAGAVAELVLEHLQPGQATPPGAALALRELASSCEPWDFANLLRECMPRLCTGLGQVREDSLRALLSEVLSAFSAALDALEDAGADASPASPRAAEAAAAAAAAWHHGNAAAVKEEVSALFRSALELLFSTWLTQARQPELRASVAEACGGLCRSLSTGDLVLFVPKLLPSLVQLHKRESASNAIATLGVARGLSRLLASAAAAPTSGALDRQSALAALGHVTARLARLSAADAEDDAAMDAEGMRARAREQQELLRSAEACVRLHPVDTTGWLVSCLSGTETVPSIGAAGGAGTAGANPFGGGVVGSADTTAGPALRLGSLVALRHCAVSLVAELAGQRGVVVGGIAAALGGFLGPSARACPVTHRRALIGLVASMAPLGYLTESGGDKLFATIPETLAEMAHAMKVKGATQAEIREARHLRDACEQAMQLIANDAGADDALWPHILDLLVRPGLLSAAPALCRAATSIARRRANAATDASAAAWNDAEHRRRASTIGKIIALVACGDSGASDAALDLMATITTYLHPKLGAAWSEGRISTLRECIGAFIRDENNEVRDATPNATTKDALDFARETCEALANAGARTFLYECARSTLADIGGYDASECTHIHWFQGYRRGSLRWLGALLAALPEDGNALGVTAGAAGGGITATAFATECLTAALTSVDLAASDARESAARLFGHAATAHLDACLAVLRAALDAADAIDAAASVAAANNAGPSPFAAIASFFGSPAANSGAPAAAARAASPKKEAGPLKATTNATAARAGLAFGFGLCVRTASADLQRARCETHVLPSLLDRCHPSGALHAGSNDHGRAASERRSHFCAALKLTAQASLAGNFVMRRREELVEAALMCAETEANALAIDASGESDASGGGGSPDAQARARTGPQAVQMFGAFGGVAATPPPRNRALSTGNNNAGAPSPPCRPAAVVAATRAVDALRTLLQGETDGSAVSRTRAVMMQLITRLEPPDAPVPGVSLYLAAADVENFATSVETAVVLDDAGDATAEIEAQRQLDLALGALACTLLERMSRSASGASSVASRLTALGDLLAEVDVILLRTSLTIIQRRRVASLALSLVASCAPTECGGAAMGRGALRLGTRLVAPLALACDVDAATRGVAAALASALCACAGVGVPTEAAAMVSAARGMLAASSSGGGDVAGGSSLARRLESARGAARPATAALDATELAGLVESCCACCARAHANVDAAMGSALVVADALAARGGELATRAGGASDVCASLLMALDAPKPPTKEVANALHNGLRALTRACQDAGRDSLEGLFQALLHGQAFRTKRRRPGGDSSDILSATQRAAQVLCQDVDVCASLIAYSSSVLWDAPLAAGATELEAEKRHERLLLLLDADGDEGTAAGDSAGDGTAEGPSSLASATASYLPSAATDILIAALGAQGAGGAPVLAARLATDTTSEADVFAHMLGALVVRVGRLVGDEQAPPPSIDAAFISRARTSAVGAMGALFSAADASGRVGAANGVAALRQRRGKALSSSAAIAAAAVGETCAASVVTERQRSQLAAALAPGIGRYDAGVRTLAAATLGAMCSSVHDFDDSGGEGGGEWASTASEQLIELVASDRASNVRRVAATSIGDLRDAELTPRGQRVLRALSVGAVDATASVAMDALAALPAALDRVSMSCAAGAASELQRSFMSALDKDGADFRAAALRAYDALCRAMAPAENASEPSGGDGVLLSGFRTRLRGHLARLFVHCMDAGAAAGAARGALKAAGAFEDGGLREALVSIPAAASGGGASYAKAVRGFASELAAVDAAAVCDVCARDVLALTARGPNGRCRAAACTLLGSIMCALENEAARSRAGIDEAVRALAERSQGATESEGIVRTAAVGALSRLLKETS